MLGASRGLPLLALLLTVSTIGAQTRPSFQAGVHGSFDFSNGEVDNDLLFGVNLRLP